MCRPMFLNKQLTCSLKLFYIQFVTNESDNSAFLACNIHHRSNTAINSLYFVIMEKVDVLFMNRLRCHSESSRGSTRSKWLFKSVHLYTVQIWKLSDSRDYAITLMAALLNQRLRRRAHNRIYPSLPKYIPLFSTNYGSLRIYSSLPEYPLLFNNYI